MTGYMPRWFTINPRLTPYTLYKALSTLSQKSETVAEFGYSRRFLRLSRFSATVWTGLKRSNFADNAITVLHLQLLELELGQ